MVAERTSFLENQPNREAARLALALRETSEHATMNYRGFYVSAKRSIVKEVLEAMASGLDVSTLFSDMLMAASTKDLVQKKLVYMYISTQASQNAELAILAINTFQKDLKDDNAVVRGLALRTICSMRLSNYVEFMVPPLTNGLTDPSAYVRKIAVLSCVKLYHIAPEHVADGDLIESLYKLLSDDDTEVVANCISALDEILSSQGGMVINKGIAYSLLHRLLDFSEWHQCLVLDVLIRYKPDSDDELFEILNILDDRLQHHNCGVQLSTIKLFLHWTADMPEIQEDIYKRIRDPLVSFLSTGSPELAYACLAHLQLLTVRAPKILSAYSKHFYRRLKDPPYLTLKKLKLLETIADTSSAKEIIDEISGYITGSDEEITLKSIETIANIAVKVHDVMDYAIELLLKIMETEIEEVVSGTVTVLTTILQSNSTITAKLLLLIPQVWPSISLSSPAGPAFLHLLAKNARTLPETPYILESLINTLDQYPNPSFRIQLLDATVAVFLERPAECQSMLERLFKETMRNEEYINVQERATFLYTLLESDIETVKKILLDDDGERLPGIIKESDENKEALFTEFSTLSVVYGKTSTYFIDKDQIPQKNKDFIFFVPPADFMSDVDKSRVDFASKYALSATTFINAKEFKASWTTFKESHSLSLPIPKALVSSINLETLEKTFEQHFIFTIASGVSNNVPRLFVYATEVLTTTLMLCEIKLDLEASKANLVVKSNEKDTKEVVEFFIKCINNIFQSLV